MNPIWSRKKIFLGLVSKSEIPEILVSFPCARLYRRNSHSPLEVEKMLLVDLCETVTDSHLSRQ